MPFVNCVSTSTSTLKLPQWQLWSIQGIKSVAVMPFEVIGNSDLEREAVKELHVKVKDCFINRGFTIVDKANDADAVFRGLLIDIDNYHSGRSETEYYEKIPYYFDVAYIIIYSLTRTDDNSIAGENSVYDGFRVHSSNSNGSAAIINGFTSVVASRLDKELGAPQVSSKQVKSKSKSGRGR